MPITLVMGRIGQNYNKEKNLTQKPKVLNKFGTLKFGTLLEINVYLCYYNSSKTSKELKFNHVG